MPRTTLKPPLNDPAFQLLCRCCSHLLGEEHVDLLQLARRVDWNRVLRLQQRHGLPSLVWRANRQLDFLPPAEVDEFKQAYRENCLRGLRQLGELSRILERANTLGLTVLTLKGLPLSQEVFGDPFFRSAKDIDLICRWQQWWSTSEPAVETFPPQKSQAAIRPLFAPA